ncbi:MAG TPA: ABC transporter substrate-binding protein [Burkholderiaceae bacterium]|nr:ABC transporter substrate-binding protein [Burkholderiaceae bacterium]
MNSAKIGIVMAITPKGRFGEKPAAWMGRVFAIVFSAAFVASAPGVMQEAMAEPIAAVMTYEGGANTQRSSSFAAGAKAYFARINAQGGVHGRPLHVVLAEFPGDVSKHAEILRATARNTGAVALLGCASDDVCQMSAQVAADLKVPLVGPLSGSSALARQKNAFVFRIRPGYAREASAIAAQLTSLACTNVVLVTDALDQQESTSVIAQALGQRGIKVDLVRVSTASKSEIAAMMKKLGSGGYHAAVLNMNVKSIESIVDAGMSEREEWPRVLITLANGSLQPLMTYFKGRVVGFSQVVPNPEILTYQLSRDLELDAGKYGSTLSFSFDGMEGYLAARLLVEGLRRTGSKFTPERLAETLASQDSWEIGGFRLSFVPGRDSGSDWVDVGLRSRSGTLVR